MVVHSTVVESVLVLNIVGICSIIAVTLAVPVADHMAVSGSCSFITRKLYLNAATVLSDEQMHLCRYL